MTAGLPSPHEDVFLGLMIKKAARVAYVPRDLYVYRQHAGQFYGGLFNHSAAAVARRARAMLRPLGAALVAAILFSILLPPFGGVVAAVLTLFGVEMLRLKDWKGAFESAKGVVVGFGWGVLARLTIGLVMIGLWLAWAFLVK